MRRPTREIWLHWICLNGAESAGHRRPRVRLDWDPVLAMSILLEKTVVLKPLTVITAAKSGRQMHYCIGILQRRLQLAVMWPWEILKAICT